MRGSRGQSLVDARDRSFQSPPCFCQFIRIWRLVLLFLPSGTDSLSVIQWSRKIAAEPNTRICGSRYSSDRNFDFPLVALVMKVALSSTWQFACWTKMQHGGGWVQIASRTIPHTN